MSTTNNSFPVGPFTATVSLTKASNHVIWLTIYRTEPLPDGNTAIFDAIGVYYQYTDNFKQHISVAARSTIRLQPWQVITSSVPITDFGQFNGNTSLITYTSPVNTLPGRYEIHGSGMWGDNTGYHLIPSTVAADVNGQVISSSTDYNIYGPMIQFELTPTKKLQKIDILPSNAIAYLHPPASNPSSGTAQFTATGNYSDNTTKDITSSATWSSSDPTIANINAGLATPRKPGTCQISATQDGVKSSDPPAILTVKCRQWTYFRQGDYPQLYDHSKANPPYNSISAKGCALTSMAMILKSTGQDFDPNILNNVFNISYDPISDTALGFFKGGVIWKAINTVSGGIVNLGTSDNEAKPGVFASSDLINVNTIDKYLDQCKPVIVGVRSLSGFANPKKTHYVLITGRDGFTYHILDPAWPTVKTLDTYQNKIYSYYVYNINQ